METKLAYIFYKHLFENYETDKVFKINNAVKSYIDALQTDKPGIHLIASPRQQGGTTDIIINALHDIYVKGLNSVQIIVLNKLEAKDIINKLKNYIHKNDILSEDEEHFKKFAEERKASRNFENSSIKDLKIFGIKS